MMPSEPGDLGLQLASGRVHDQNDYAGGSAPALHASIRENLHAYAMGNLFAKTLGVQVVEGRAVVQHAVRYVVCCFVAFSRPPVHWLKIPAFVSEVVFE